MSEVHIHSIEEEKEPSSFRLIITLGIAGFLSGLILVSIYLYTKPIIANNKKEALQAAIFEVLPNTSTYKVLMQEGGELRVLEEGEEQPEDVIYQGLDSEGKSTGFALPGSESGYQDIIAGLIGYGPESESVIGFKVLESKETPGLGDKIYKDKDFQTNFNELDTDPRVQVVKKGEKNMPNQIEAITGATISSNAIGRLINKALDKWKGPVGEFLNSSLNSNSNSSSNSSSDSSLGQSDQPL